MREKSIQICNEVLQANNGNTLLAAMRLVVLMKTFTSYRNIETLEALESLLREEGLKDKK